MKTMLSTFNFHPACSRPTGGRAGLSTRGASRGFTLIETLIAIFILALTIGALLTLTAGGFFSIRYAKNDIVASNLLQESLEYIRNTRDSAAQRSANDPSYTWGQWILAYENENCNTATGCMINPYAQAANGDFIKECDRLGCDPLWYYDDAGFYGYPSMSRTFPSTAQPIQTTFVRTVTFDERTTEEGDPEVIVTAHIEWKNGTNKKQLTQSILLTPWNISI